VTNLASVVIPCTSWSSSKNTESDSSTASTSKKRQRNKELATAKKTHVPENEITENDVLCGRGTGSNLHPGNIAYRQHFLDYQPAYKICDVRGKRKMIEEAIQWVEDVQQGRFLAYENGRYYIASKKQVRDKVSQYLREDQTPEGREQKRARLSVNRLV